MAQELFGFKSQHHPLGNEASHAHLTSLFDREEEEIVQLSAADVDLTKTYFDISNKCANYFENTLTTVIKAQNGWFKESLMKAIAPSSEGNKSYKNFFLMKAREEYASSKNKAFD